MVVNVANILQLTDFNKLLITIAHRLSQVQKADKILVLDQGIIVQEGTKRDYSINWYHLEF